MAERTSILTGRSGPEPKRAAAGAPSADDNLELKAALSAMELLKGQLERMAGDLSAAHADAAAARVEATAERTKTEALRAQLMEEADACGEAEGALAAARAASEGLAGQLATERDARASLQAPLEQAIAAAAAKQPINIPAYEAPAYELEVTGRDINERAKRIVLKPIKAGT